MDRDDRTPSGGSPLGGRGLQADKYNTNLVVSSGFKLDEGYSDDAKSMAENDGVRDSDNMLALPDWLLSHSEADRAGRGLLI